MEAQQLNLNNIANNIANVNSTGYKRTKVEFQDLLYQTPNAKGAQGDSGNIIPTGLELGNGSRAVSTTRIFSQGQLTQTDSPWDVSIDGGGFFQVTQNDGTLAYTRDGSFKVDATGQVVTSSGLPVQGIAAAPDNYTGVVVLPSGEVSFETDTGQVAAGTLQLAKFNNPNGLKAMGGNLYTETEASGNPVLGNPESDGYGSLVQGFLEMSNVNVVEEMINMIVAQRAYEINSKAIQASDEMMAIVNQVKR